MKHCEYQSKIIALYLVSTSNHNCSRAYWTMQIIALYLVSTSNHNVLIRLQQQAQLLYTLFLHQTTTAAALGLLTLNCFIPCFYIKPQLWSEYGYNDEDCFIPCFYIKPQLVPAPLALGCIALYLVSTSNHNHEDFFNFLLGIALYLVSTSNHNLTQSTSPCHHIALYLVSTSNHNYPSCGLCRY